MNDIDNRNNHTIDLSVLLDEQYSLNGFRESIIYHENELDKLTVKIKNAIRNKLNLPDVEEELQYSVVMDDSIKEGLADGSIKLDTSKEGKVFAQVRRNGKFGEKLEIQEELKNEGITDFQMEMAIQSALIQEALLAIVNTLQDIQDSITDIKIGQVNDRIGLYYSGLNMFIEASTVKNENLRHLMLSQALKSLNDSNAQMTQGFRDCIQYLTQKQFNNHKGNRTRLIDEKMAEINYYYQMIHKAQTLKAYIYYENNELDTMALTFKEYGKLIENLVIPNEGLLREYDKTDTYLQNGTWEKRAKNLLDINKLAELPAPKSVYYIEERR